ncbi:MAG: class I SAM-dependent methyltransferase [Actinomycetota bacterium]
MTDRPWIPNEVEFVADFDRPELATSPWAGHRWFGYDLVRWMQPMKIVELGTHYACSFFAFCQALQDDRSNAEVMAVDTWEGEEHSGRYGEEVYDFVARTLEHRFATVNARLQRSLFDDALDLVEDGSVDILHIDGLHTYEAVSHDYTTWVGKLAPNGVVLFHDVAPSSGYESAQFWQEIQGTAPGFAFLHSFGLGVLLPNGTDGREELLRLGSTSWRSYYQHRAGHDLRGRQVIDMTAMIDARDEALAATTRLVDERTEALQSLNVTLGELTSSLESDRHALTVARQELGSAKAMVDDLSGELSRAREVVVEAEQLRSRLAELDAEHRRKGDELELQRHRADRADGTAAELQARLAELADEAERTAAELRAEVEHKHHHLAALTDERDALAANLDLYRRTFKPIRWASQPPRRVLRRIRGRALPAIGPGEPATEADPGAATSEAERTPVPALFDPDWYLARYPDIARAGVDPGDHWTTYGWREGRQPCPLFDAGEYLQANADVGAAGLDPLAHWAEDGWREDRDPSSLFDTGFYRSEQDEPLAPTDDPLSHYLRDGIAAGAFVSPAHREAVLSATTRIGAPDQLLADVVADLGDGNPRSVPLSFVADLDADLVTFDLWDTLLSRTRPADASKLATARRTRLALGLGPDQEPSTWDVFRHRVEIEARIAGPDNGEYLLDDVLTTQLTELVERVRSSRPEPVEVDELAARLHRAELEDEMRWTRPIDEAVAVLEKLRHRGDGVEVAVVSDFYLGADDLRELLDHHGLARDHLAVVSSADLGLSKHADGALLDWIRERHGVSQDRHVHIGDNPHADVAMQIAGGGTAVHLVHGVRRHPGPGQLDESAMSAAVDGLTADLDASAELRCRQAGLRARPSERTVRAAWRTALLPVSLVAAAIEDAGARGLDRVHYLSREGSFLARVHEEVAPILAPARTPRAVHLAVSRRSTFGPSMDDLSPESLLDLWRMYPHQTPRGLLTSLGADPADLAADLDRHGLALDEMIEGIHLDGRVSAFLGDGRATDRLRSINDERRRSLLAYLASRTDLDLDQLLLVDVGWRGTIQDNLARMLPETRLVGWYLALFPFLNPQPVNGEKHAVGPDGNRGQDFAHMEPPAAVERPWTPALPSVVDYRLGSTGPEPVLDEEALDDRGREGIARYQDAVVEAATDAAEWIVATGASTDVLRPVIEERLRSYYATPEPGIADLWFDNAHDDTFGVLNVTSFGKDRPSGEWLRSGLGPGFLGHLEAAADASLWPAGYRRWRPVAAATAVERALRSNEFGGRR